MAGCMRTYQPAAAGALRSIGSSRPPAPASPPGGRGVRGSGMPGRQQTKEKKMTGAANKELVRGYLREAWDEGRSEAIDRYLAPDFRSLNAPPGSSGDREAERQLVAMFLDAFGSFRSTIDGQVAQGSRVLTSWSAVGIHQAPFVGVEPTGRVVSMRGTELATVADGRIESIFAIFDMAGLLQQLGVVPGPPPV